MNSQAGINIVNAAEVITKTYENIKKLMSTCQYLADGSQTPYLALTNRFLRYKSDIDWKSGWLMRSFILLYQRRDEDYEKKKNGNAIFGMDVNLESGWVDGKPAWKQEGDKGKSSAVVCLAKYLYEDTGTSIMPTDNISPADHWKFYHPLYELDEDMKEETESVTWGNKYIIRRTVEPGRDLSKYMGVKSVIYTAIPLVEINADNLREKIFGTFDKLAEL